jgi:hypothetical protein
MVPKANEFLVKIHAAAFAGDCEMGSLKVPLAFRLPF